MHLRRALLWMALGLGFVTFVACLALVLLTTLLRRKADEMDGSHRAARLAADLSQNTLAQELETTPTGRARAVSRGKLLLHHLNVRARAPVERDMYERLVPLLQSYWMAEGRNPRPPPRDLVAALMEAEDLFVLEAQERGEETRRLDALANVVGVAIAVLLAAGVLFFLWLVQIAVFRPIQALAASVERFAAGDLTARAPIQGADEIRRIAATHNRMADALARTREDQLRYVATVVHDLRNPLAAVQLAIGYVTPGRALPPEARVREIFELIGRQLRRLNSLVGDVLNAVQVETGDLVLHRTDCSMGDLAVECVSLFEAMSPYHRFELTCMGNTELLADSARVEQVLNNLVGNAVKYSPIGSLVRVAVEGYDELVAVAVTDEGPGISPELEGEIFRPFIRGLAQHEEIAGIGLGLYVTRRIVEAHGGTVDVESVEGRGATFRATFPRGGLGVVDETRDEDAGGGLTTGESRAPE